MVSRLSDLPFIPRIKNLYIYICMYDDETIVTIETTILGRFISITVFVSACNKHRERYSTP